MDRSIEVRVIWGLRLSSTDSNIFICDGVYRVEGYDCVYPSTFQYLSSVVQARNFVLQDGAQEV
ncbi:hypothetical protein EJB05_01958, partial [Eragrostis curvula]